MSLTQVVNDLEAELAKVKPHLPELESVQSDLSQAQTALTATKREQADIDNQIKSFQAQLAKRQADADQKFADDQATRTDHLNSLDSQIQKSQADLADLTAQVTNMRQQHDQILASMDSLRKKLG